LALTLRVVRVGDPQPQLAHRRADHDSTGIVADFRAGGEVKITSLANGGKEGVAERAAGSRAG
jgi:hypothetical protein